MSQVPIWFERKFDFSFPFELYPNLCIRLRGTPARQEEIFRGCSREVMLRKPEGKWSAQENAGHLLDLEPLWLARVEEFLSQASKLRTADLSNQKTHQADHNAKPLSEILAGFRQQRLKLIERLRELDAAQFTRTALHPRLKKPMRLVDHLYFVAEHDDHHLARIWELVHTG
jgi:uncharacterized damage-inducible protein DinB